MGLIRDMRQMHPKVVGLYAEFHRRVAARGIVLFTLETRRERTTGEAYFARGREVLSSVNARYLRAGLAPITLADNARRITNAKWFETWHYPGLAEDWVPMVGGVLDWAYTPSDRADLYDEIIAEAVALGMTSGKSWHDYGHVEYHPGVTLDELRAWAPAHPETWVYPL